MGRLTSMVALVLVLAGLGAYIYFVDSKRPTTGASEEKTKVFTVEAAKLEELTITSDSETSTLRKIDGTWRMTAPIEADGDQSAISSVANALSTVEVNRVVDENASNLADYGLATPRITLAYKAAGSEGQLLIGDKTPSQSDVYAMKPGEKRVFLISGFNESTFAKKPFDLRDKRILNFERDKIDSMEVVRDSNSVVLARSGSDWVVKQPVQVRGDYSAIEALITKLASGSMTRLVAAAASAPKDAAGLAKYGLAKPVARISLGSGSARSTLALGKEEEGALYAQDQGRGLIFTVDPTFLSDLKSSADDYRDKELFESRAFNADQVRVVRGTETLEFRKAAGSGENAAEKWQRTVDGKPIDIDTAKMEDFLAKLTGLRAQSFVTASPSTGLAKPSLVVSSSYDNGKFERVRIAKNVEVFGARDGEPGVAKLDTAAYDETIKALDAALAPPAPAPSPSPSPSPTAKP
jgi:hypothetical protein